MYAGIKKPINVNNYLHDFNFEIKNLLETGIKIGDKSLRFKINAFVCDAPAGAFIRGIVGHNALNGCNKCDQIGTSIRKVVTFDNKTGNVISDDDFMQRKYPLHHHPKFREEKTELETLGIGMISQFPLDCMHLIDLGVTRKIINSLLNGKAFTKLKLSEKNQLSVRLKSLYAFIPREFNRKPRGFEEIAKW